MHVRAQAGCRGVHVRGSDEGSGSSRSFFLLSGILIGWTRKFHMDRIEGSVIGIMIFDLNNYDFTPLEHLKRRRPKPTVNICEQLLLPQVPLMVPILFLFKEEGDPSTGASIGRREGP